MLSPQAPGGPMPPPPAAVAAAEGTGVASPEPPEELSVGKALPNMTLAMQQHLMRNRQEYGPLI